jgi:predicted enzyme related to lactoylglutathione lyase
MERKFLASRDVIIRNEAWAKAIEFYGSVLGLPVTHRRFLAVRRKGQRARAAKRRLIAAGCTVLEEDASIMRC